MASIQGALRDVLAADPTVAALLGGTGNACRIYPLDAPAEKVRPYVLYRRVAEVRDETVGGTTNLREAVLIYDGYGAEEVGYASIDAVMQAIVDKLLSLGRVSLAAGAIRLEAIRQEGLDDDVDPPEYQEEMGRMRASEGFRVWWNQG